MTGPVGTDSSVNVQGMARAHMIRKDRSREEKDNCVKRVANIRNRAWSWPGMY